ncbi:MAG: plasmid mobilization relaxosome protein MobC [Ruminococcus sp.]|nr:plasmid mobilization relaxosome protein MobC [Ruminococcus sp.]
MKDENKRDLYLKVRVSQAEMDAIKRKFANSGMSTLSGFVRAMIFEGYIVHIDENTLKEIHRIANNVANNINQIAHRANVTQKVYKEDIEDIKSLADKLIQPLLFLQSKCLQLKH